MKGSVCLCRRRTLLPNTDADAARQPAPHANAARTFEQGLLIAAVLIVVITGRADAQPAVDQFCRARVVHPGSVDCRRADNRRGKHHRVRIEGRPAPGQCPADDVGGCGAHEIDDRHRPVPVGKTWGYDDKGVWVSDGLRRRVRAGSDGRVRRRRRPVTGRHPMRDSRSRRGASSIPATASWSAEGKPGRCPSAATRSRATSTRCPASRRSPTTWATSAPSTAATTSTRTG